MMRPGDKWRLIRQLRALGGQRLAGEMWRAARDGQLKERVGTLAESLPALQRRIAGSDATRELQLLRRLLQDRRVPLWHKAIPVAALAYVVSPLDLIPDALPGIGQLDDIAVLTGSLRLFRKLAPADIVAEHLAALDGEVVAARSWQVRHD